MANKQASSSVIRQSKGAAKLERKSTGHRRSPRPVFTSVHITGNVASIADFEKIEAHLIRHYDSWSYGPVVQLFIESMLHQATFDYTLTRDQLNHFSLRQRDVWLRRHGLTLTRNLWSRPHRTLSASPDIIAYLRITRPHLFR